MAEIIAATKRGLHSLSSGSVDLADREVTALSPRAKWAIVDRRELWRQDGSWELVAASELELTCVVEHEGSVHCGTESAHLLTLRDDALEVVPAFEEVEGRSEWFTPWGGPPAVRSLAASPAGDLYVNVHVGGIVKGDSDANWEPTVDVSIDVHEVRCHGDLIVAACAIGLAESGDAGYAWNYDDEGLHARYARAVAVGDDFLFLTVAHGPRGGDAAVYRQPCDGSTGFERCALPSFRDNIDTGCVDARGTEVAFGTVDGELYRSADHGATWELIVDDLPPVNGVRFVD